MIDRCPLWATNQNRNQNGQNLVTERERFAYPGDDPVRRASYGAIQDVWRPGGFAARAGGFARGGVAAHGYPESIRHLRGLAARLVVAGGLFREPVAVAAGFRGRGMVAAIDGGAGQRAAGTIGVSVPAIAPSAADG